MSGCQVFISCCVTTLSSVSREIDTGNSTTSADHFCPLKPGFWRIPRLLFNALLSRNCTVSVLTFSFLFQLIFFRFQCSIWKVDFFRIIPSKFSKSFESLFERKIKWNTDCCKSFSRKNWLTFLNFVDKLQKTYLYF